MMLLIRTRYPLNITPYSVVTLLNRASLYLEKNLFDRAYVDYCNVIDIDKTNKEALLFGLIFICNVGIIRSENRL